MAFFVVLSRPDFLLMESFSIPSSYRALMSSSFVFAGRLKEREKDSYPNSRRV
jgi:hypothetical protein